MEAEISNITPTSGASSGGTLITITGQGFSDTTTTVARLSAHICEIQSVTYDTVVCLSTVRPGVGEHTVQVWCRIINIGQCNVHNKNISIMCTSKF